MTDPVSGALIVGAFTGGAAGKMVEMGGEWVIQLFASHSPAVQAKAQANLSNFVVRLEERVKRLEQEIPADKKYVFESALSDPSTSLLLQKTFTAAASTELDERHEILSELIVSRLTAGAEDMVALAGMAACDVVVSLSSKQIKLLGLSCRLLRLRPTGVKAETQEQYDKFLIDYWKDLKNLSEGLDSLKTIDFYHLEGVSCISTLSFSRKLGETLKINVDKEFEFKQEVLKEQDWWPTVKNLWDMGIDRLDLTTTGGIIGTLYHDSKVKIQTSLNW